MRSKPLGDVNSRKEELSVEGLRVGKDVSERRGADPIQHTQYGAPPRSYAGIQHSNWAHSRPVTSSTAASFPSSTPSLRNGVVKTQGRTERSRVSSRDGGPELPVGDGWIVEGTKMTSKRHAPQQGRNRSMMTSDEVAAALFD